MAHGRHPTLLHEDHPPANSSSSQKEDEISSSCCVNGGKGEYLNDSASMDFLNQY